MSTLARLEAWYLRQCNGDWEHQYGVTIDPLDNPGWSVTIDLTGTKLERVPYNRLSQNAPSDQNWLDCRVERGKWKGVGAPLKLNELLEEFLSWAEKHDS